MIKGKDTAAQVRPQAADAKPAAAPQRPVIFTLQAVQDTWLKKSLDPAVELPEDQKVLVPARKQLPVVATSQLPRNSHELVELGASAGQWHVYMPHFRRLQGAGAPAVIVQPVVIDWSNFSSSVTPNLTVGEVLQFDHRRRPSAQSAAVPRILETAREFQAIRTAWGQPLGISSFDSSGLCIDIYATGMSPDALYDFLSHRWTGGLGDGRLLGFIQLDRSNGGRFVPGGGVRPFAVWPIS